MKDLIKEIIKTFEKENRKNRKLVKEQEKRIKELELMLEIEEQRTTTFKNRIKRLERQNVELIRNIKEELKTSVSGLKGHLTKDKVISLIEGVK